MICFCMKQYSTMMGSDATTRHDDEPVGGMFAQLPQQRESLIGSGLLP